MINFLGAYVFTLILLVAAFKRVSLRRWEDELVSFGLVGNTVIFVVLALLFLSRAFRLAEGFWLLTVPEMVITGFTFWVHEAGHVYWRWGGEFLMFLGGTLNEIAFSLGPAAYCFMRKLPRTGAIFLLWCGYNCFDISPYIADARAQALPVVGDGLHDWHYLLGRLGMLEFDRLIANVVWLIGCALGGGALAVFGGVILRRELVQDDKRSQRNQGSQGNKGALGDC